ncbi:E3 ubiquitin-protein ligase RKP isoform X2 [Cryptomeria japonica]|uniref:E3 ubiquitin-protein ligase RKP isoform X2 n=1 Tax=Cryptomeria japonica TaxID=3369 RepID=UPI0027DA6A7F|nr:E3 ubiquitin-protein ligase RKP isoform X2 [Cryptomeria japonica]
MGEEGFSGGKFQQQLGHSACSGLAIVLSNENDKDNERRELERTLGHIFEVPGNSLLTMGGNVFDVNSTRSILKAKLKQLYRSTTSADFNPWDGVSILDNGFGKNIVAMDDKSASGDIRFLNRFLLIESQAMFSSARANACVLKGKWMYEVTLETAGIQQLGWATLTCPFTHREGVGDDEDSYAYDGRRIRKWNKDYETYGHLWVVGDVIGCCINLDASEISFYRNGVPLGVAFDGLRKLDPGFGYFPAISLSQGERCDLNFGSRPFKYPIADFLPIQVPPKVKDGEDVASLSEIASYLLRCLLRLVKLRSHYPSTSTLVEKLRRLKRFTLQEELLIPIGKEICQHFFCLLDGDPGVKEHLVWGALVPFMMETFGTQAPHDGASLDRVMDLFLSFPEFNELIIPIMQALAHSCKTSAIILVDCPCTGSYPYLALACHLLRREEIMMHWWQSADFESSMEGLLSRKGPNKQDLQGLMPSVWWPGSREDVASERNMRQTTLALSRAICKVEEMQWELCRLLIHFSPLSPSQPPGLVFRTFLQTLVWKNRGADRNMPPPGLSNNSVLVSVYTVLLRFLSEGFGMDDVCDLMKGSMEKSDSVGLLHRKGKRRFPIGLFLRADSHCIDFSRLGGTFTHLLKTNPTQVEDLKEIEWDEGCMEVEESKVTHSTGQKPSCCSGTTTTCMSSGKNPVKFISKCSNSHGNAIPERAAHVSTECGRRNYNNEIVDKPSSSEHSDSGLTYQSIQQNKQAELRLIQVLSGSLREEELLDTMVLLYHLGLAPNFKQASHYMSHQSHSISLLDDTDKQIRAEKTSVEHLKRLKEARNVYREDLVDCIRQCTWYKVSLSARWKQRGMYATCMWVVQLLLILSKTDQIFLYVPEFYLEALVDCFHALRRSDPPFVSPGALLQQGLTSFVTFLVMHFNDPRIANADLRDVLLQSISVLVQYKEYMVAFESNKMAIERMPGALLSAFDNRFWIPVTNILLRLFKGSGFGTSKHGESWSSLFQVPDLLQRKCMIIFELSCNLARVLEFFTHEIPQAFLCGYETNMTRLTELIIFVLNHTTSTADAEFLDNALRQQGQSLEKVNRAMIWAPLVGIVLNLANVTTAPCHDLLQAFANMDSSAVVESNFQYLMEYNWVGVFKGDPSLARLVELKRFLENLKTKSETNRQTPNSNREDEDIDCCICYANEVDTLFVPCNHKSCRQCISRHLLNNQRCFFCNSAVSETRSMSSILETDDSQYGGSGGTNILLSEGVTLVKPDTI